jgi:tetratricopeptide (TPR) repeat protein
MKTLTLIKIQLLLILILFFDVMNGQQIELADNYLLNANQAFLEKDLKKSENYFYEGIKLFQYLPEAYLGLAKIYMINNQKDVAIEKLKEVIKFDNTFVEAQIELANIYFLSGETNLAINVLDTLLLYDIFNADAEYKLAYIYEQKGNLSLAKIHYEKAYLLAPNQYESDYERSIKFIIKNPSMDDMLEFAKWRKVEFFISRLNVIFKTQAYVNILLEEKNSQVLIDAIKSLEKCSLTNPYGIELNEFLSQLYMNFAISYSYYSQQAMANALHKRIGVEKVLEQLSKIVNDKESAAAYLRRALQLGLKPEDKILVEINNYWPAAVPLNLQKNEINSLEDIYNRYKYFISINDANSAEALLKERIQLYPREDLSYAILGLSYYNKKDYEQAFLFFRRSIEMFPTTWINYITFINTVYFLGNKEDAISLANFVLMNSDNESVKLTIKNNMNGYK